MSGRALRRPGDHHRERPLARLLDQRRLEREPGHGVEHDAPGLPGHTGQSRGELRIVGQSRADAHRDRVALCAPAMGQRPALLPGYPLGIPGAGGHLPVQRHGRLEHHPRPACAGVLTKRLVLEPGSLSQLAVDRDHLDALVAQDPQAASGRVEARVLRGHHHPADAGTEDGVGARRCAPVVTARLD